MCVNHGWFRLMCICGFYISMCVREWVCFFSGFFKGHWPHGAKGVRTRRRMRECWIKGKTSPKEHLKHQWIWNFWACVCFVRAHASVWITLLNLSTVFDPIRWSNPLSKREKFISAVGSFLSNAGFYVRACVCWPCGYNSFWLFLNV